MRFFDHESVTSAVIGRTGEAGKPENFAEHGLNCRRGLSLACRVFFGYI
jgi:hypothetical protein